jgi:hypothetical protein
MLHPYAKTKLTQTYKLRYVGATSGSVSHQCSNELTRISGVNWVRAEAKNSGRPSVANMALQSPGNKPMDDAVAAVKDSALSLSMAEV